MNYQEMLLSKNGLATKLLSSEFLKCVIGEKVPTVTDFGDKLHLSRGTIQNSIKFLQDNKAIRLESRGHLGNYLINKNVRILLEFAGITSIVGAMPLPYSKKYEGFATGLIVSMENQYNIPCSMAYMRGAKNRIGLLLAKRCDYAVLSKYAANEIIKKNNSISIIKEFGPHTYLSEHIIIFNNENAKEITDGMKIGIDFDSIDQKDLTERVCEGKKVQFVHYEYSRMLERVLEGDIDAAVWNKDEITDKIIKINFKSVEGLNIDDTEAVIVINSDVQEMASLLDELIDVDNILNIQKLVLEDKITPSY